MNTNVTPNESQPVEPRCEWCGHGDSHYRGTVKPYAFFELEGSTDFGYTGYHGGCYDAREASKARRSGR